MSNNSSSVLADTVGSLKAIPRFEFGRNWQRFLESLNEQRISLAEESLCNMLGVESLQQSSFLDVGCGSGLFSLAAMRKGAERVFSFDYDPQSVACGEELKRRYFPGAPNWTVQRGDVLDPTYLSNLGQFDVVYSWGVLHHTGKMWQALGNVVPLVRPGGKLFIAIYNDQGLRSSLWTRVKVLYNYGVVGRLMVIPTFFSCFAFRALARDLFLRKNSFARLGKEVKDPRGMAFLTDLLDWLGGYPFEVAKPEEIFDLFRSKGFELVKLKTAGVSHGNNEFVFVKCAA